MLISNAPLLDFSRPLHGDLNWLTPNKSSKDKPASDGIDEGGLEDALDTGDFSSFGSSVAGRMLFPGVGKGKLGDGNGDSSGDDSDVETDADAQSLQTPLAPKSDGYSEKDLKCEAALKRHEDRLPNKMVGEDVDRLINDKNTPPDLKEALMYLKSDEGKTLKDRLDTAGKGGDTDGCISHKDLDADAEHNTKLQEYTRNQAKTFYNNYIPSDNQDPHAKPRQIDGADAAREFYKYADYLPKRVDEGVLRDIVSGKLNNKCPPQLMAAAQYFLNHPAEFQANNRDYMQDDMQKKIRLTADEQEAIETLNDNHDAFFKDGAKINREKLQEIAKDEKQTPKVRKAAEQLLKSPVLFGMLDNGRDGHGTGLFKENNDGFISDEDVGALKKKLTPANMSKAPPPVHPHKPRNAKEAQAYQDMANGVLDQPDIKHSEGGGMIKFGKFLLRAASKLLDVVQIGLDLLASLKIPIVSQLAAGAALGVNGVNSFGLKAEIDREDHGTSVKASEEKAGVKFALGAAGTALSAVGGVGLGKAVFSGTAAGAGAAGKAAAGKASWSGVGQAAKAGAIHGNKAAQANVPVALAGSGAVKSVPVVGDAFKSR